MLFLGIDVGTGGSRAVLIDQAGKVVASHATEHVPFQSKFPGWAEQDPEDWWRASQESIRAVLSAAQCLPADIAAVGLTGQMHGAVLLDADGQVLRPSLIWCDTRSGPQCDWLHAKLGREHVIELTCNPALPNFTLTKILWVREHEPEIFARIAHILCPKDYARFRLSGVYAMDVQEASGTLLLDVTHRRWSIPMAEASGVPIKWLPQLFESAEVCAKVSKFAAAATGLVAGTPIVAGAGDQGAGAVGMGILKPGSVSATIGTSGVVFAATDAPIRDPFGRLHTFCHAVPGRWHVMGVTQAAGLSLRWFRDVISAGTQDQPASYEQLMTVAAEAPQAVTEFSGRPISSASVPRTLIPMSVPHLSDSPRPIANRTSRVPCSKALPTVCAIPSPCLPNLAFPFAAYVSAAAARAVLSGDRFKPISTVVPSSCSSPKKVAHTVPRCLPVSAQVLGRMSILPASLPFESRKPSLPIPPQSKSITAAIKPIASSIPRSPVCALDQTTWPSSSDSIREPAARAPC